MGRPAKPTNLKLLQGAQKCRINDSEPIPMDGELVKPQMSDAASAVWDSLSVDLQRKGVLTPWDAEAFATYCQAIARNRQAAKVLDDEGPVKETNKGFVKSPWNQIWRDTAEIAQRYGARFGLTPSDRAQLSMKENTPDGTRESLLS